MALVHKSFGINAMAAEAEFQADVKEFLGVVPMVVGTPGGGAFIVLTICQDEEKPSSPAILLPNGQAAPRPVVGAPKWRVRMCYEGMPRPEFSCYVGSVMTERGPVALYARRAE